LRNLGRRHLAAGYGSQFFLSLALPGFPEQASEPEKPRSIEEKE